MIAFDLETSQIGPNNALPDKVYFAGVYPPPTIYPSGRAHLRSGLDASTANQVLDHLLSAEMVVTHNGLAFDFRLLARLTGRRQEIKELAYNHIDLNFWFFCHQGYLVSLNSLLTAAGLSKHKLENGKEINGAKVPLLIEQHLSPIFDIITDLIGPFDPEAPPDLIDIVTDYLMADCQATLALAQRFTETGQARWLAKSGNVAAAYLGRPLTVRESLTLPLPDVSWMKKRPFVRGDFITALDQA